MNTWEIGLTEEPFAAVVAGKKTIEGRLHRGKFAKMQPGEIIAIRADYYDEQGILRDGLANAALVKIVAIRPYATFHDMLKHEDYRKVAGSLTAYPDAFATAEGYNRYYSETEQRQYGVLAIEIQLIKTVP